MEKELNNCGNTRKALYLRLYSVCLNYTIRAHARFPACQRGNKHTGDRAQARSLGRADDMEYLQPPLPPRGRTRRRYPR